MKRIAIVVLFAFVLAGSAFAGDKKGTDKASANAGPNSRQTENWQHKKIPPVEFTGRSEWATWRTRDGVLKIDPSDMYCSIVEARLTFGRGHSANLYTKEDCGFGWLIRTMNWDVVLQPDGRVAMRFPDRATYNYPMDGIVKVEKDQVSLVPLDTGCSLNGTFPTYYGYFDGHYFHAVGEFESVCTGGTMWGDLGISEADGLLHADFLITLEAID